MCMYKSFKYRIYPNEEQKILLEKHFGCTRFVYNYFLDYKQTQYKTTGTSGTCNQIAKELVNLKEDSGYSWLNEVNSQSLQQSLKDMFNSYEDIYYIFVIPLVGLLGYEFITFRRFS